MKGLAIFVAFIISIFIGRFFGGRGFSNSDSFAGAGLGMLIYGGAAFLISFVIELIIILIIF